MINDSQALKLIRKWRRILSIDPRWEMYVVLETGNIKTPDKQECEAYLTFHTERWQADIHLPKDKGLDELEHQIVHELLELSFYEKYDIWWHLVDSVGADAPQLRDALNEQFKAANNRVIEKLVPALLDKDSVAAYRARLPKPITPTETMAPA